MRTTDDSRDIFSTALNAGSRLWWARCWIRATLLAGMWVTLAWVPVAELPRACGQLLIGVIALSIAFAHSTPGGLDVVARVQGTDVLVNHLSRTSGRATIDASGLGEGLGALMATLVYVGWFPVTGFPVAVRSVGLALAVCYSWEALLQAVIDPGWYSTDDPPARAMRVFRYAIPVIFAGIITFVLLPWQPADSQVPLLVRVALSASPAVYYLVWAVFDVMLRASAIALRNSQSLWRWDIWGDVHSSVKNTLVFLNQYAEDPDPDVDELRGLIRNALVVVDDFRGQLIGAQVGGAGGGHVSDLWNSVVRALGNTHKAQYALDDASASMELSATDYQIAQRVLPDLFSNAMKAGASQVGAKCSIEGEPRVIRVEVADNGAGMPAVGAVNPQTSLGVLRERLRERNGGIEHSRNATGGMTAVAYWHADRGVGLPGIGRVQGP